MLITINRREIELVSGGADNCVCYPDQQSTSFYDDDVQPKSFDVKPHTARTMCRNFCCQENGAEYFTFKFHGRSCNKQTSTADAACNYFEASYLP